MDRDCLFPLINLIDHLMKNKDNPIASIISPLAKKPIGIDLKRLPGARIGIR